jgi:site-specific DNA recombinase
MEGIVEDKISKEDYDDFIFNINEEIKNISSSIIDIENSLNNYENEIAINELIQQIEALLRFKHLSPEILHRLIDKIGIIADGSPRIYYRFSDHLLIL